MSTFYVLFYFANSIYLHRLCSPYSLDQESDHSWPVRQKIYTKGALSWWGVGGTWPALSWKFRSLLKCHSLILTPILHKLAVVIFRQQLKTFDSNNFTLSSMFSVQNEWPIKTKAAVYTLVLFHIFIHFLVKIGSDHNLI